MARELHVPFGQYSAQELVPYCSDLARLALHEAVEYMDRLTSTPVPVEPSSIDPLEILGQGLFLQVLRLLDLKSLVSCMAVSTEWLQVGSDDTLWEVHCCKLWAGKAHVNEDLHRSDVRKVEAYRLSLLDGRRTWLTENDLCQHFWQFRFKQSVGEYWLAQDPAAKGGNCMLRLFLRCGRIMPGRMDKVFGSHECTWHLIPSREESVCTRGEGGGAPLLRVNYWPALSASRREDWSWVLENCWVIYTSLPDAQKITRLAELQQSPSLSSGVLEQWDARGADPVVDPCCQWEDSSSQELQIRLQEGPA